jgi:hypothetical protein
MGSEAAFFGNVAQKDYLDLWDDGNPKYQKVAEFLEFTDTDVARATGVPPTAVRLVNRKVPEEVVERVRQWAQALNLVAHFFGGDVEKTQLWFRLPNPLLGNVIPRDMIRIGRFQRLYQFIQNALADAAPPESQA